MSSNTPFVIELHESPLPLATDPSSWIDVPFSHTEYGPPTLTVGSSVNVNIIVSEIDTEHGSSG